MYQGYFIIAGDVLIISCDTTVEVTCTGQGNDTPPQWTINSTLANVIGSSALRVLGVEVVPEIFQALDENNNFFRTIIINGSIAINASTIECILNGEVIFPSTELVYLAALRASSREPYCQ